MGCIVGTLLVRDEEDILLQNIEHHLANGVDWFIATDNNSKDSSRGILETHPAVRKVIIEESCNYHQSEWVTRMSHMISEYNDVDWVVHFDADEFWSGLCSLREIEKKTLVVKSATSVISNQSDGSTCRYHVPLLDVIGDFCPSKMPFFKSSAHLPQKGCKVAHRPNKHFKISQGNHNISGCPVALQEYSTKITIDHYPVRSFDQFTLKVKNGGSSYVISGLPEYIGFHWREWYRAYLGGALMDEYLNLAYSRARVLEEYARKTLMFKENM